MLKRVIAYAHELLENSVKPGETVIDGTCGNGNDSLFLSNLVGSDGNVLAFDIQEQAINNTRKLLENEAKNNVTLIQESHHKILEYLNEDQRERIGGAIFNLGYLPGSDKEIITKPESTISAIEVIGSFLKPGGIIVLVVYHGHPGGELEKEELLNHLGKYDQKKFNVVRYGFINQKNSPPFVLAIEKK
ncbi:methyltransferase domain-containing protein [Aquibacillus halophilus]|uniref:Methyltransferase domain-containing protein n=1 Tax=Aquibacillus halophilus TaxID=930132 RepID=A0A6A8DP12_9BACI|nr:class I SAM-dependent methyltransferase [Aquibacillus halophilus]MRH44797.1 methyltransferase domain-containing protein [Aquibacillus halophilus]